VRLILLPGLDGSGRLFRRLIERLPESVEPIVVGYPPDLSSYSALLPIVRAAFPTDEPFVILAESYSGPLAVMACSKRPKNLAGMVLAATFVRSPCPYWISRLAWIIREPLLRWIAPTLVPRVLLGHWLESSSLVADVREAISGSRVLAARIREVLQVDVTADLAQIDTPILYLAGGRDAVVKRSSVRLIQRYAQRIRVVTVDAPHLVLQVAPEVAAREISEFAAHAVAF
jgi:pimeloyl-ACP methyl ester carboxylesterase